MSSPQSLARHHSLISPFMREPLLWYHATLRVSHSSCMNFLEPPWDLWLPCAPTTAILKATVRGSHWDSLSGNVHGNRPIQTGFSKRWSFKKMERFHMLIRRFRLSQKPCLPLSLLSCLSHTYAPLHFSPSHSFCRHSFQSAASLSLHSGDWMGW